MIWTWATPSMVEIWFASRVREYWSTFEIGRLLDQRLMKKIGDAEGSFLRKLGGLGIARGSRRWTPEIAAWTSWAAASMLRSSLNCSEIPVKPWPEDDVMESTPGTVEKALSSGVATAEAMVSGSAPGRLA